MHQRLYTKAELVGLAACIIAFTMECAAVLLVAEHLIEWGTQW